MDHSSSMTNSTCVTSMLWNWNTIDSCFIAEGWHITNNAMFAASCIGVFLLALTLEALRRASREYEAHLHRTLRTVASSSPPSYSFNFFSSSPSLGDSTPSTVVLSARATPLQQLVRTLLHIATFGIAYILMLLAMYYNGYIIISILLGTGAGKFVCDWLVVKVVVIVPAGGGREVVGQEKEDEGCEGCPTVCCG